MRKDILLEDRKFHDINPLECGWQQCSPIRYSIRNGYGPFTRSYYVLHYVFSGHGVYHTPKGDFSPTEGQIFVIYPHEETTYIADSKDPWHYCWVGFESALDLSAILSSYVITASECAHIFRAISDSNYIESGRELYICSKLYELFSLLDRQSNSIQNRTLRYVRMAQNYIKNNYQQELRVDKLAEDLNLDRCYFSKIFRKHTGKSPQRYVVDFRLDMAAGLLIRHDMPPCEVARYVGYTDSANFSRMFRKRFGIPPSAYRGGPPKNASLHTGREE